MATFRRCLFSTFPPHTFHSFLLLPQIGIGIWGTTDLIVRQTAITISLKLRRRLPINRMTSPICQFTFAFLTSLPLCLFPTLSVFVCRTKAAKWRTDRRTEGRTYEDDNVVSFLSCVLAISQTNISPEEKWSA